MFHNFRDTTSVFQPKLRGWHASCSIYQIVFVFELVLKNLVHNKSRHMKALLKNPQSKILGFRLSTKKRNDEHDTKYR
jgi:hypothetical protein